MNKIQQYLNNVINNINKQLFKKQTKIKFIQLNTLKYLSIIAVFSIKTSFNIKNFWINLVKKTIKCNTKKKFLYVFCIGLFNCIATTPFSIIIILPITFGSLFYILEHQQNQTLKHQVITITSFLFGHFVSIFWWLFIPLTTDFIHLFWITPFAILGLPFLFSIIFLPFFILFFKLWCYVFEKNKFVIKCLTIFNIDYTKIKDLKLFFVFLLSWFCGDYVRGHIIFGGFPWMMFGHFVNYSFAFQSVKLFGVDIYSIFFLSLVLIPYFFIFKRNNIVVKKVSYTIFALWIINCVVGLFIITVSKPTQIKANIVASQANIPATLQEEITANEILSKNVSLISWSAYSNHNTIMLMPESAINMPVRSGDYNVKHIANIIPNNQSILIAGGVDYNQFTNKLYNVSYAINSDGYIVDVYHKQKLVPFGEYLPFREILPEGIINITGMSLDFSSDGDNDLFILYRNLPVIYPTICYESIFPQYVKKNIKKSRKQLKTIAQEDNNKSFIPLKERGEIIINLTNDAWLKWSVGPYQHFLMARFLAVYTGLPVVRVSNNGISAYIEKTGVVKTQTGLNKEDILYVKNI